MIINNQPLIAEEETALIKLKTGPSNIKKDIADKLMKRGAVYFLGKSSCRCSGDRYSLTEQGRRLAEQSIVKYNLTRYPKRCIQCGTVTMNGTGEGGKIYCRRCLK